MSWILILDPWVLSPEITLAASLWYLDCPGERKVIKPRSSSKLASVPGLYMEARCKSCTKGLCIWTWKHKQQNSIDHFCFFVNWAPLSNVVFLAQNFHWPTLGYPFHSSQTQSRALTSNAFPLLKRCDLMAASMCGLATRFNPL